MDQIAAIRVFARVVEAGTFTRAADLLQMPKPSVTKQVQQLESHLHVKLLQRTTRRVTVTPEGAAYYERISRVLAEIDDIEADVTSAQTRPRGRLRVDIGSSLANRILIPRLPAFNARYPDILLELGVGDRPVHLIGEGVDCVLRGGVLSDPSLVARRVAQMPYMTCATPDYLKRHGVPATPADLVGQRKHGPPVGAADRARRGADLCVHGAAARRERGAGRVAGRLGTPADARVDRLPVEPAPERQAARLCRLDGGSVRAVRSCRSTVRGHKPLQKLPSHRKPGPRRTLQAARARHRGRAALRSAI